MLFYYESHSEVYAKCKWYLSKKKTKPIMMKE